MEAAPPTRSSGPGTETVFGDIRFKHGRWTWRILESIGQARAGPAGCVQRHRKFIDVTDACAGEEVLHASKQRLRTVVAGARSCSSRSTPRASSTLAEGKGLHSLVCAAQDAAGKSFFEILGTAAGGDDVRRALAEKSVTAR